MKYAASCFLAMIVAVGLNIGTANSPKEQGSGTVNAPVQQTYVADEAVISGVLEITEEDMKFEQTNPIVYRALFDITESWNKLDALEKSGIPVGHYKKDAYALAEYVRKVGAEKDVTEVSLAGQTLNDAETVVYHGNTDNGAWVTNAAAYASYKELIDENSSDLDGTADNAKKHAKWSATAVIFSGDAQYTKYFTDAHEFGHPANFADEANFYDSDMDMKNNAAGREIGTTLRANGRLRAMKNLDPTIEQYYNDGKLTTLK